MMPDRRSNSLARALRGFFTDHLPRVRGLSRHTILGYRDAFKLLLRFLETHCGRSAATLDFPDLTPESVLAFLEHLETQRGNSVATRNARLSALHAFARYAAAHHPEHLDLCQRLLAVPGKRASQAAGRLPRSPRDASPAAGPGPRKGRRSPRSRTAAGAVQYRRACPRNPRPATLRLATRAAVPSPASG